MNIKLSYTQPKNMKKISILFCVVCLIIIAFTLAVPLPQEVCRAGGILDILTPKVIEFYEVEIAHKQVVSTKSNEWLERVGSRYDISVQKVKAVMIVQDFCTLCGDEMTFSELAKCSDYQLFAIVKEHVDVYLSTLDDAQKEELKQKASELFSIKTK